MSEKVTTTTITDFPNSIDVSRNAKGEYSWSAKVYGDNDLGAIIDLIENADTRLRTLFGRTAESIPETPKTTAKNAPETGSAASKKSRQSVSSQGRREEEAPSREKEGAKRKDEFDTDGYDWDGAEKDEGGKEEEEETGKTKPTRPRTHPRRKKE